MEPQYLVWWNNFIYVIFSDVTNFWVSTHTDINITTGGVIFYSPQGYLFCICCFKYFCTFVQIKSLDLDNCHDTLWITMKRSKYKTNLFPSICTISCYLIILTNESQFHLTKSIIRRHHIILHFYVNRFSTKDFFLTLVNFIWEIWYFFKIQNQFFLEVG